MLRLAQDHYPHFSCPTAREWATQGFWGLPRCPCPLISSAFRHRRRHSDHRGKCGRSGDAEPGVFYSPVQTAGGLGDTAAPNRGLRTVINWGRLLGCPTSSQITCPRREIWGSLGQGLWSGHQGPLVLPSARACRPGSGNSETVCPSLCVCVWVLTHACVQACLCLSVVYP